MRQRPYRTRLIERETGRCDGGGGENSSDHSDTVGGQAAEEDQKMDLSGLNFVGGSGVAGAVQAGREGRKRIRVRAGAYLSLEVPVSLSLLLPGPRRELSFIVVVSYPTLNGHGGAYGHWVFHTCHCDQYVVSGDGGKGSQLRLRG